MTLPDWARAYGRPLFAATIRTRPEDFRVTEVLGWPLSGHGEHDYLLIEKTGANTEWVARQLARHADVPAKDVGYAGLKDRHAVTTQWFSVPRWHAPEWSSLDVDGVVVLDAGRHHKKLRRGAHRGNAFRIVLRGDARGFDADALRERVALISGQGVPNYFGEQRFGHDGGNLQLADDWAAGKRLPRHKRGIAISTIRSFLFNEALDKRVRDGTWNRLVPGDSANLDGTGSVVDVEHLDDELVRRCEELDIHPTGILAGKGSSGERTDWIRALNAQGVKAGSRSLRLRVNDLLAEISSETVSLSLALSRGSYATSVLREIGDMTP